MHTEVGANGTNVVISVTELREAEAIVWVLSFICVSVIGLFARYLDELEEQRLGKLKLRNTNLFCATFTSAMAVFYVSVAVLQGGSGSMEGFRELLVGKRVLSPLQEFQACIIHALMLGYMTQDLVGRLLWANFKWQYILHHVACIVGLVLCLGFEQTAMFGSAVGISESTTPIVAMLEIARADDMKTAVLFFGLLLNVVFPFRVALFTYITYLWAVEHVETPFGDSLINWEVNMMGLVAVAVLTMLNWIWWKDLVTTTVSVLLTPKPKTA